MNVSKRKAATTDSPQHQPPKQQRATKRSAARGGGGPGNIESYRDRSENATDYERLLLQEFQLDELESLPKSTRAKYNRLIAMYNDEIKDPGHPLLEDDPKSVRIVLNWVKYVRNGKHDWDPNTRLLNTKHMKKILELQPVELTEDTEEAEKWLKKFIQTLEPKAKVYRQQQKRMAPCNPSNWISFLPRNLMQPCINPEAAEAVIRDVRNRAFNMEEGVTNSNTEKHVASRGPVVKKKAKRTTQR